MACQAAMRPRNLATPCRAVSGTSTSSRAARVAVRVTRAPSARSARLRGAPQRLRAFARGDEAELAMPTVDELMALLHAKRFGQGLPEDTPRCVLDSSLPSTSTPPRNRVPLRRSSPLYALRAVNCPRPLSLQRPR
jgi:hypothetical protein